MELRKPILIVLLVLSLVAMACGVNINLPMTKVKTGPTVTDDISVPLLKDINTVADLTLAFGAGEFNLSSGAKDALVSGTATYNVSDFKPKVSIDGSNIRVEQGDLNIDGIPNFTEDVKNVWDLKLGPTPMKLHINAGAYQGRYELGGLSLQDLDVTDGASDVRLAFSDSNLVEMNTLRYQTGASDVRLTGLANANFDIMIFRGGAGNYVLDFTGTLKRDATVNIESGISTVTIIIPKGVAAKVTFTGGLSNVTYEGTSWQKNGDEYSQTGSGPSIRIIVNMGVGTLDLRNK